MPFHLTSSSDKMFGSADAISGYLKKYLDSLKVKIHKRKNFVFLEPKGYIN